MKHLVSFFVIILITFCFNNAKSEELLVAYIDMEKVARDAVKDIGYNSSEMGFNWKNFSRFGKTYAT